MFTRVTLATALLATIASADGHLPTKNSKDLNKIILKTFEGDEDYINLQTTIDWNYAGDGTYVETILTHNVDYLGMTSSDEKKVFQYYTCLRMPDPICFVSIGFQSKALDSITANIYNLSVEAATVDGPDSITIFPNEAALATYYFYNGKVGDDEPCEDCRYSVHAEDIT